MMPRPRSVVVSVALQAAILVVNFVSFLIEQLTVGLSTPAETGIAVVMLVVVFGFWIIVAVATWRGRNWARILQTVLLPLQIGLVVFDVLTEPVSYDALDYLLIAMSIAAVILLWTPSSRRYFADVSAERRRAKSIKLHLDRKLGKLP
jgi:hypothetical protein